MPVLVLADLTGAEASQPTRCAVAAAGHSARVPSVSTAASPAR